MDYIDKRYTEEIKSGEATYSGSRTGMKGFLNSVEDAEGYPDEYRFKGGEASLDSDIDGMPDEWEILHDLNPYDYYDACQIYLSDEGYTNIELYINELMGDPVKYSENPVIRYEPEIPTEEPTVCPIETPLYISVSIGDVNADGYVDAEDALHVLKHAAKIDILLNVNMKVADVVEDGVINAEDALIILKIAAKIN